MRTVGNKTSEARRLKNTLLANPFVPYDENLRYMHIAYARTHTRTRDMNAGVHSRENVPYVSIYRDLDGRANCKIAGQIEAKIRSDAITGE